LNGQVYLTPATPTQISYRLVQWNTIPESYAFPGKPPSIGYPDWGFARVLCPGSGFTFYLLWNDKQSSASFPALEGLLAGRSTWVRLGKFNGKTRLQLVKADSMRERVGAFQTNTLLNWRDLAVEPVVCDVLAASLPTRLINHGHFADEKFYEVHFGEETVQLPQAMRFLARTPQPKTKSRRKK
jgi:CRISPR type I-D-associated protein Csc1